jgi:polyferredoxin
MQKAGLFLREVFMSSCTVNDPSQAQPADAKPKKKNIRRAAPDRSQAARLAVQLLFVLLNVFLCARFYLFVRYFESGVVGAHVSRPAGVDGWLPIAGLMNVRYFFATGRVPAIHPAAMVLLLIFGVMSLLLKRAFCSWLCPVGTLSEYLWKLGRRLLGRNLMLPRWADIGLRSIKYLLLAFFVFIVGGMSAEAIGDFMAQPYGILADVKMLRFFTHMSSTAAIVIGVLALLSLPIKNFWCRYACPYGALMSLLSAASPVTIRRDAESCIDCGKCSKACPQQLPVDRLVQVRSVECTACLECVASCATQDALQFALPPRAGQSADKRWRGRRFQPAAVVAVMAVLFFGGVAAARATHHWQTNVSDDVYRELIPHVDESTHPGF